MHATRFWLIIAAVSALAGCGQQSPRAPSSEPETATAAPLPKTEAAADATQDAAARTELFVQAVEGPYTNTWSGALLKTQNAQADVHVLGEGKTVDFDGVLSLNCEPGGSQHWKTAANFDEGGSDPDTFAGGVVPPEAVTRARALYCPG